MRIVHAVCSNAFAGVERYVATPADAQSRAGETVTVIGGDMVRMPGALEGSDVCHRPAAGLFEVVRLLRRQRAVDVVHAHMTAAELASALSKPIVRAPIVVTRHFARRRGSSMPARLIGHGLRHLITAQISISRYVADRIDGPSRVIHLGTRSHPDPLAAQRRDRVVLIAQRFEQESAQTLGSGCSPDPGWPTGAGHCGWPVTVR